MKALVKSKPTEGLWLEEVDIPQPNEEEIRIKITQTAICGTDLHIYLWDKWSQEMIRTPLIIGHEYVGYVDAVGKRVTHLKIGDRVTGEGHIACGYCRNCRRGRKHVCEFTQGVGSTRDGAFAEYLVIPALNALRIHPDIPDEVVSIMDPLGNATHTALSFPLLGEDVFITGAGLIGSMAIAVARFAGARHIIATEINPYRLELARKMGATYAFNPLEEKLSGVLEKFHITGFDVGLECSGNPHAFSQMLDNMYNSGKVAMLGILTGDVLIDWTKVIFKGLTLKGIFGRKMYETWYKMEQMLCSGMDISPIITHRLKVEEFKQGFELMRKGNCGKVILDWTA